MLTLHLHPFSSFCHKALIALYEMALPFERVTVNFGDAQSRADFFALWPIGKIPVLEDSARGAALGEVSVIIEYLQSFYPRAVQLIPAEPDAAWRARLWDRLLDHYVHYPMQQIVADRLRPEDARDPYGVRQHEKRLRDSYALIERQVGDQWLLGADFTIADCAAAPALFFADLIVPIAP
ncbi:MAG: glutathione S-transferase family protein, partial [Hyphomonadaceae bacterium]